MFWLAATLLAAPAHADDLTVIVDAEVESVRLECGMDTYEKTVSEGTRQGTSRVALSFPIRPGRQCEVTLIRDVGSLEQLGTWACAESGCLRQDQGEQIEAGPGEVHVLVEADLPHEMLELSCPGGYRMRTAIAEHRAVFNDVPADQDCVLNFKGGPPMRFTPMGWGAWTCHLVSNTPVCKKQ